MTLKAILHIAPVDISQGVAILTINSIKLFHYQNRLGAENQPLQEKM